MKEPLLTIRELSCGYHKRPILRNINLDIYKGELIGIIGPNGTGKTTLLRAISRILKPLRGRIMIEQKDIWKATLKDMARKIAVVSQSVEPVMIPVAEYITMGRIPYYKRFQVFETKKDKHVVEKYMALTDTQRLGGSLMSEISGGERQLAHIARALAQEPTMILLDEPTSHLDISHQIRILDLIKRLNKTLHLTVIMVLHDLNLAGEYCNRLVLLNQGEVYKAGTPDEILSYKVIEDVYKTPVIVERNPLSGKPYALLVTEEVLQKADMKGKKS